MDIPKNANSAEEVGILIGIYYSKHQHYLLKDPTFREHLFAHATDLFMMIVAVAESRGGDPYPMTKLQNTVGHVLRLGMEVKYGRRELKKYQKYIRDIGTQRGIINCLARETLSSSCQCMARHKVAAKTMDKLGRCQGCNKDFPKTALKRCSRCLNIQYCSMECMKSNWLFHKPFCFRVAVQERMVM
mmetsp:Transcript_51818/g.58764  ORF Transcript_51818/g.58764 Transcript_51818/m.58764 type:complete len:187 (+) Transcript_51818:1-561(+)